MFFSCGENDFFKKIHLLFYAPTSNESWKDNLITFNDPKEEKKKEGKKDRSSWKDDSVERGAQIEENLKHGLSYQERRDKAIDMGMSVDELERIEETTSSGVRCNWCHQKPCTCH